MDLELRTATVDRAARSPRIGAAVGRAGVDWLMERGAGKESSGRFGCCPELIGAR